MIDNIWMNSDFYVLKQCIFKVYSIIYEKMEILEREKREKKQKEVCITIYTQNNCNGETKEK